MDYKSPRDPNKQKRKMQEKNIKRFSYGKSLYTTFFHIKENKKKNASSTVFVSNSEFLKFRTD